MNLQIVCTRPCDLTVIRSVLSVKTNLFVITVEVYWALRLRYCSVTSRAKTPADRMDDTSVRLPIDIQA